MSTVFKQAGVAVIAPSASDQPFRVAIVGCGPRGLQCLESLSRQLPANGSKRLQVSVYEPADSLGAGAVYDPGQPHHLRMNFASKYIDFWKTDERSPPSTNSLVAWLSQNYPDRADPDGFVPRAVVGEYLSECYRVVLGRLREIADIVVKKESVTSIRSSDSAWRVITEVSSSEFDEIAITLGHEGLRESQKTMTRNSVPVFPVQRALSADAIPAGSAVKVCGFGLTAIDAMLTLTEGRGGEFDLTGENATYNPSGLEPKRIEVQSRSGRPALAKPTAAIEPVCDSVVLKFVEQLESLASRRGTLNFVGDVWPILCDATASLLCESGVSARPEEIDAWFQDWIGTRPEHETVLAILQDSYRVATGNRQLGIAYALGEVWRRLYAPMVAILGSGGLLACEWSNFQSVAIEMERIAFGPPAENVAKMIALMDNGIVHCKSELSEDDFDYEVNAVIAPPHPPTTRGPIAGLVSDGVLNRDPVTGGVMVDVDGRPMDANGDRREGMAIFGRATEGWVIGNDTLSRTLHKHILRWSESVAEVAR